MSIQKIGGSGSLSKSLSTGSPGQNVNNTFKNSQASNIGNADLSDKGVNLSDEDREVFDSESFKNNGDIVTDGSSSEEKFYDYFGKNIDLGGNYDESSNASKVTVNATILSKDNNGNLKLKVDIKDSSLWNSNSGELLVDKNFKTVTSNFSEKFNEFVKKFLTEARNSVQLELIPGDTIENAKFEGLYNDIFSENLETPNRMTFEELQKSKELLNSSYAITRCTGFRDFVFKIWMAIWGFFHWEFKFVKNNGATNKLYEALRNNNSNLQIENLDNLEVIDTPRDGNCMLWSALTSAFGSDTVRENFSYFRNSVIPWLRGEIAENWSSNGRKEELTKHLGLGAAPIKSNEMGTVAKSLRRNIFIVADTGSRETPYTGYVFTSDGNKIDIGQGELGLDKSEVIEALNNGITIFSFKEHARAVIRQGQKITINNSIPERSKQPVATNNNDNAAQEEEEKQQKLMDQVEDLDDF